MANIQNYLNQIKTAVFGKDVRESIHNAIKQCYDDAAVNHDNANMEVKLARGSYNTLNDRLDENEKVQENFSSQLDNIATLYDSDIEQLLNNLKSNITIKLINNSYSLNNDVLIQDKENIEIDGNFSTILLKDSSILFKFVSCKNLTLKNLNIVSNVSKGGRNDGILWFVGCENVKIDNVTLNNNRVGTDILESANVGFMVWDCIDFTLENCKVLNTERDGIHITRNSKNVTIKNNTFINNGDDAIAIVGYYKGIENDGIPRNVYIENNIVENSKARGISILGCENVYAINNTINSTSSSGIYIGQEKGLTWETHSCKNVKVEGNTLYNIGYAEGQGNSVKNGIWVFKHNEENSYFSVTNINVLNNKIYGVKTNGIEFNATSHSSIINNTITNIETLAFKISAGCYNLLFENNIAYCKEGNLNNGVSIENSNNLMFSKNSIKDIGANVFGFVGEIKNLTITENTFKNNTSANVNVDGLLISTNVSNSLISGNNLESENQVRTAINCLNTTNKINVGVHNFPKYTLREYNLATGLIPYGYTIKTGSCNPTGVISSNFIGEEYIDTTNNVIYKSTSIGGNGWKAIT